MNKEHEGRKRRMLIMRVKQFFTFFLNLFFLANFVVGSLMYIFVPGQRNPIPEPKQMTLIGITTAVLAFVNIFLEK